MHLLSNIAEHFSICDSVTHVRDSKRYRIAPIFVKLFKIPRRTRVSGCTQVVCLKFFITFVHETAAAAADFGVKSSNIAQTALGLPGPERPRRPKKTSRCDSTYATYAIFPDNLRTVRVRYFAVR